MQIAYPVQLKRSQEPYGVIRRHPFSTLFHPFFVDFGYDKIIYYHMVIGRSNHIHHFCCRCHSVYSSTSIWS